MVIALLALGLVMILGGIAAVVQGFPYVRLESGLAMVIGGTTAASAGAILLGLAAVVLWLKRLDGAVAALRFARQAAPPVPDDATAPGEDIVAAPFLATVGRADTVVGEPVSRHTQDPGLPPPRIEPDTALAGPSLSSVEPWLPEPQARPGPAQAPLLEEVDSTRPPEREEASEAELSLRPSLDGDQPSGEPLPATRANVSAEEKEADERKPDPQPSEPEAEPRAETRERDQDAGAGLEVIGTYSSGGNTYVMFADGTIEADTPRGRFNFNSLEELKDFVDSGGEHETRGAA